ncbi:unnamed protein product, partial [Mesorhabditis spiculigera]
MTLGESNNQASVAGDEENERLKQYKNVAKHEDMRRRRTECSVELRKQKRDETMMKRRNLVDDESDDEASEAPEAGALKDDQKTARALLSFEEVIKILTNNPSLEDMRRCFESVRRSLSKSKDPPIDSTIESGLLQALVQALAVEDDKIRFEAAWALTNIVSGTSRQTYAAVQAGATRPLVELMLSPNLALSEQCLWAVANIIGDSAQLRDQVIDSRGAEVLVHLVQNIADMDVSFVRTLAWAFSNMCRHKTPNAPLPILRELAQGLRILLTHDDKTVRQDSCWAASYLTDGPDEQIQIAVEAGLPSLVKGMLSDNDGVLAPALRVLGNMATGNDQLTQYVVDLGVLDLLPRLVERTKSTTIVKECCWLISNIIAGTQAQIQAVIDANLLPLVVQVMATGDFKCQLESSWVISNLAQGGSSEQIMQLWQVEAIAPLCGLLKQTNVEMIANVLDSLYALLTTVSTCYPQRLDMVRESIEENSGLDHLEGLQEHESERIYQGAYKIIQEFFSEDEDDNVEFDANDENQPVYNF